MYVADPGHKDFGPWAAAMSSEALVRKRCPSEEVITIIDCPATTYDKAIVGGKMTPVTEHERILFIVAAFRGGCRAGANCPAAEHSVWFQQEVEEKHGALVRKWAAAGVGAPPRNTPDQDDLRRKTRT
jgi:hypothetical protein